MSMICFFFIASSVPRNLMIVSSPGRTNITVQWTEPASPNGNISSYKVRHVSYFHSKTTTFSFQYPNVHAHISFPVFHSKILIFYSKLLVLHSIRFITNHLKQVLELVILHLILQKNPSLFCPMSAPQY